MKIAYGLCLSAAFLFLGWADTHTDGVSLVLGFVLLAGGLLGITFPRRALESWVVLGGAVFVTETLVHFSVLRAPYQPSSGLPWPALVAYVPAALGVGIGAGVRRLMSGGTAS